MQRPVKCAFNKPRIDCCLILRAYIYFHQMFFVIVSLLHPTPSSPSLPSISPKFPLRSADPRRQIVVLTAECSLLVCMPVTMLRIESVRSRRYACAEEKLARISRHGTVPRSVHLLDVPSMLLRASGRVPCSADGSRLI